MTRHQDDARSADPAPTGGGARLAEACASLRLFPLPDLVFLPNTLLPLHVFEPRYRALVSDAIGHDRLVAVPRLAPGWQDDYAGRPAVHPVCCVGRILQHEPLSDGRSNILLSGVARVRILDEHASTRPWRAARACLLADAEPRGGTASLARSIDRLRAQLLGLIAAEPRVATLLGRASEREPDPLALVDLAAHVLIHEPEARQAYLEQDDPEARVERVVAAVAERLVGGAES